jgi:SAM-dependent methyltransferase
LHVKIQLILSHLKGKEKQAMKNADAWIDWFQHPSRAAWLEAEKHCAARLSKQWMRGPWVQIGQVDDKLSLMPRGFKQAWLLGEDLADADVMAQPHALPFAQESIDTLLLVHVLEKSTDWQALLSEAHRVLVGGGQAVIFALNPWALRRWVWVMKNDGPKACRFISLPALEKGAKALGFDVKCRGYLRTDKAHLGELSGGFSCLFSPIYGVRLRKMQRPLTLKPEAGLDWLGASMLAQMNRQPTNASPRHSRKNFTTQNYTHGSD